jgi:hypothetical protein
MLTRRRIAASAWNRSPVISPLASYFTSWAIPIWQWGIDYWEIFLGLCENWMASVSSWTSGKHFVLCELYHTECNRKVGWNLDTSSTYRNKEKVSASNVAGNISFVSYSWRSTFIISAQNVRHEIQCTPRHVSSWTAASVQISRGSCGSVSIATLLYKRLFLIHTVGLWLLRPLLAYCTSSRW